MQNRSFLKLGGPDGEVEVDETFVGGAADSCTLTNTSAGLLRLAPKTKPLSWESWSVVRDSRRCSRQSQKARTAN